jgi:hypothetical protein
MSDIASLRARAKINLADNLFTKDELKRIFISNYNSTHGMGISSSLNNNMSLQCFRNSSYYLLSRVQSDIWDSIDTLPVKTWATMTTDEKNLYIYIQTFIELMDDQIINRLGNCATPGLTFKVPCKSSIIEEKRTNFIDTRLNSINTTNANKHTSLGVQIYGLPNGGYSSAVVSFLKTNYLKNIQIINLKDVDTNLKKNFDILGLTNLSNYILIKLEEEEDGTYTYPDGPSFPIPGESLPDTNKVYPLINDIKLKKFNKHGTDHDYKLVGMLYDCPVGIAHQVTSLCYGDKCLETPPEHIFHDDKKKFTKKLITSDFTSGKNSGLDYGCATGKKQVLYLLYEKLSVQAELQAKITAFITANPDLSDIVIKGGGMDKYYSKYLKYKQKYLQLKKLM